MHGGGPAGRLAGPGVVGGLAEPARVLGPAACAAGRAGRSRRDGAGRARSGKRPGRSRSAETQPAPAAAGSAPAGDRSGTSRRRRRRAARWPPPPPAAAARPGRCRSRSRTSRRSAGTGRAARPGCRRGARSTMAQHPLRIVGQVRTADVPERRHAGPRRPRHRARAARAPSLTGRWLGEHGELVLGEAQRPQQHLGGGRAAVEAGQVEAEAPVRSPGCTCVHGTRQPTRSGSVRPGSASPRTCWTSSLRGGARADAGVGGQACRRGHGGDVGGDLGRAGWRPRRRCGSSRWWWRSAPRPRRRWWSGSR